MKLTTIQRVSLILSMMEQRWRWAAMDKDCCWRVYSTRPRRLKAEWSDGKDKWSSWVGLDQFDLGVADDWRFSLVEREPEELG